MKQGEPFVLQEQWFALHRFADSLQLTDNFQIFAGASSLSVVIGLEFWPFLHCHRHFR